MKKTLIPIISLIASVLAFSSCGKEEVMPQQDGQTVVFNVSTELAKTTFGTVKDNVYPILWDEKDTCVYVSVNGGTSLLKAKLTSFNSGKNAKISLTLKDDVKAPYTFILSPTAVGYSGSNGLNIPLPATQTSSATSVDRAAIAIYASKGEIQDCSTPVDLTFKHFAAYGKLALKNLPAGAELQSVTLTAEEDWVGNWYLKVDDGTFTPKSGSTGKALTVNTTSAENIWFACAPVDLSNKKIKITAITSKGQYTKTITLGSAHKFISGQVAEFTVNMAGINPDKEEKYTLTAIEDINETDEVVITMKLSDGTYYAMTNDNGTKGSPKASSVTVSGNVIVNPAENLLWNIKSGTSGYVIYPNGEEENHLYTTEGNSNVRVGTTPGEWFYDSDSNGTYLRTQTTKEGKPVTRFLGVYVNNTDWRTYTSKTSSNIKDQNLCLFVKAGTPDTRTAQNLSFPKDAYEAELGSTFAAPALSGAHTTVTYSSSNTKVATVNAATGAVTLVAAGKTTITANAEADETYKAGRASYELTVKSSGTTTEYASLADLIADGEPDGRNVTVTLTNEEITSIYVTSKGYRNGIIFTVGQQEVEIFYYDVPENWEVGGKVSGKLTDCPWVLYGSTWELAPEKDTWAWTELSYTAPAPTCATPVITLDGSGCATITCETEGATIKYAVSDTEPASFTNTYSAPVQLTNGQTIWAKATKSSMADSKVVSKKFTSGSTTIDIIAAAGITASVTLNADNNPYEMGNTGITLTGTKGSNNFPALNYNANKGTDLRFYKGTTCGVTFAIDGGRKITKIEFLKDASTASNLGSSFSVNTGTLSGNVWTGEASSITLVYSAGDNFKEQMYIINVTYAN